MRVYVWCPGEPFHQTVMDLQTNSPVVMFQKPTKITRWDDLDSVNFETVTLQVRQWVAAPQKFIYVAFRYAEPYVEGTVNGGVPTVGNILTTWPETIPLLCELFNCPECGKEQYGFTKFETWTVVCMVCTREFSEQYLDSLKAIDQIAKVMHDDYEATIFYEKAAASEFEGVSGLDESLWNDNESGLL